MGVSSSRIEEDKALQLCRDRKKFVRQALDGRCSLAAAHVSYIQSLRSTGTALRKFIEPDAPAESSLYTSTNATPEPVAFTEKSLSHFSLSSPSVSQRHETFSPSLSPQPQPPGSSQFQVNHMRFRGFSSRKVEEKPPVSVIGTVTSSSTPQTVTPRSTEKPESSPFEETPPMPPETPWDYFDFFHPIDDQFSSQDVRGTNQTYDNNLNYARHLRAEEGGTEAANEEKDSPREKNISQESDDEFDEPSTDTLVRSFENFNRVRDQNADQNGGSGSPDGPSTQSVASESESSDQDKSSSPQLSPVRAVSSTAVVPNKTNKAAVGEDSLRNKIAPKDFFTTMKEIELLFIRASESGKEVPRMLEANKLHFRPIFPGKESKSPASTLLKSCFSCGEELDHVQEEPAQDSVRYLTWHRTESSRSSSSRPPLGLNSDDVEELNTNLFDNICMIAGSHASTLDRLYAWERKLYDEVKASKIVREEYDMRCKLLRQMESKGESSYRIDKIRAVVKDLHSRIRVAIQRIDNISKRIEELRDEELQPQLEELIEGLSRMWDVMSECHKLQFQMISVAYKNSNLKINFQSEAQRQITSHLEGELGALASSFTKWIAAQRSYLQAINEWLLKCVLLPQQSTSKRKRRASAPSLRNHGPPVYVTCGVWLEKLDALPTKEVSDSVKLLAADIAQFLPRQEKKSKLGRGNDPAGDGMLRDETAEVFVSGFDRFTSGLEECLGAVYKFSDCSVKMYVELKQAIADAKKTYEILKARNQAG